MEKQEIKIYRNQVIRRVKKNLFRKMIIEENGRKWKKIEENKRK